MTGALTSEIATAVEKGIVAAPLASLLGLRAETIEADHVRLRLPFRHDVTTLGEMVHGGAIASLVDVAATAAAWAHPGASPGARGSTVGFSIQFLAPGLGRDLVADARIRQRGRSLCTVAVEVADDAGGVVACATVTYRLSPPRPEVGAFDLVRRYAEAKSQQDVAAALSLCHPDFTIETPPFAAASRDRGDSAAQLRLFFSVFPDYAAETEGLASGGESVAWWGRISMTLSASGAELLGVPATGRTASLPATSVFDLRDGLLVRERFLFDLATLCEGLGVPVGALSSAVRTLGGAS